MPQKTTPMDIIDFGVEPLTTDPYVLIREKNGNRYMRIYFDPIYCVFIFEESEGIKFMPPPIYDLFMNFIESAGAILGRVVITDFEANDFNAQIIFKINGNIISFSATPGDAVVLALKTNTSIEVMNELIEKYQVENKVNTIEYESPDLKKRGLERIIEKLNPEDIGVHEN